MRNRYFGHEFAILVGALGGLVKNRRYAAVWLAAIVKGYIPERENVTEYCEHWQNRSLISRHRAVFCPYEQF